AQPDALLAGAGDIDVDSLWKSRVMFDARPDAAEIDRFRVRHEEDEVRVADIARHRLLQRSPTHRQGGRVHWIGKRDVLPPELRRRQLNLDILAFAAARDTAARGVPL